MPSIDLFQAPSPEAIKAALRASKAQAKRRQSDLYELAVDYMDGKMLEDTRAALQQRYPNTQHAPTPGEKIQPVVLPLTERFVEEAADAYNQPVKREIINDAGEVQKEPTEAYNRALGESSYDEHMHQLERIMVTLKTCSLWFQAKRGRIRPRVVVPHKMHPIVPADTRFVDPADVDDYLGFIVELVNDVEDQTSATARNFVFLTASTHHYFEQADWTEWDGASGEAFPNPFAWPQVVDGADGTPQAPADLPLQLLTVWHARLPLDELIIDADPEIVLLNRELNVQWSALLDTMRTQGFAQMFMNLLNPGLPPARVAYGSRFAIPLGPSETLGFANTGNNYSDMVEVLKTVPKLIASLKRQNPNDFATEGQGPESGFAKLVSNLPKMEARRDRITRLKAMEEQRAWPRQAAILSRLGKLTGDVRKLKLRVKFANVEVLETAQEKTTRQEHAFKYDLSSPAHELAQERGISLDDAEKVIEEHAKRNEARRQAEMERAQQAGGGAPGGFGGGSRPAGGPLFGGLARRKSSAPPKGE